MSETQLRKLQTKARRLADLIVRARPAQLKFHSEQEFLDMLSMPVRHDDAQRESRS